MTTKKTPAAESAATAKFATTSVRPDQVASETQKMCDLIKANPALAAHPEIQAGITAWQSTADVVDQTSQKTKALHVTLTSLVATMGTSVAAWRRATTAVLAQINSASAGSAQAIKAWGFPTTERHVVTPTLDPPTGLRVGYAKDLTMTVRWAGVKPHLGYVLQMGDGTPQGWGAAIPCPRASYVPAGLTPGQKVAFRVAVQRKNGQSNWSDVLSVTAR